MDNSLIERRDIQCNIFESKAKCMSVNKLDKFFILKAKNSLKIENEVKYR